MLGQANREPAKRASEESRSAASRSGFRESAFRLFQPEVLIDTWRKSKRALPRLARECGLKLRDRRASPRLCRPRLRLPAETRLRIQRPALSYGAKTRPEL